MISSLKHFALVVLQLMIFKVCRIIEILKIVILNFYVNERVKKIWKLKKKNIQKPLNFVIQPLFK